RLHHAVDVEPARDVAAKVCRGGAQRGARGDRPDAPRLRQTAADHIERAEARAGKLEDGWRVGRDVVVDGTHLVTDVAPRVVWESAGRAGAVEPAQSRQTD